MGKVLGKIKIFSALEVANLCGVVNQTAINWIKSGYLKAFMTPGGQYRIYIEDLVLFLEQRGMRIPPELDPNAKNEVDWNSLAIVDDDTMLNDLIKSYLVKKGPPFSIFQAFDGFEAGTLLAEKRPGFVILDIDLPGIDGIQICQKVKSHPSFGKPFVITMTGLDSDGIKDRALAAGADAFFSKPMDIDGLVVLIAELAGKVR
jgi:excisionase family DNA binding protein